MSDLCHLPVVVFECFVRNCQTQNNFDGRKLVIMHSLVICIDEVQGKQNRYEFGEHLCEHAGSKFCHNFPQDREVSVSDICTKSIATSQMSHSLQCDVVVFAIFLICASINQVHIQTMLSYESVRKRWIAKHGKDPTEEDINRMYKNFIPIQKETLKENSNVLAGQTIVLSLPYLLPPTSFSPPSVPSLSLHHFFWSYQC